MMNRYSAIYCKAIANRVEHRFAYRYRGQSSARLGLKPCLEVCHHTEAGRNDLKPNIYNDER